MAKKCPVCQKEGCKEHAAHWGPDWQWFALRVTPGRELGIEAKLREADHFTFVPLRHVMRQKARRARRKVLRARAQYPGYVFIGCPPAFVLPWIRICEVKGILGPVGRAGEPVAIQEESMTAMLAGSRRPINFINGYQPKKRRKAKAQNTAEIVSGPYQGKTVRVVEIVDDDPELYELFKAAA